MYRKFASVLFISALMLAGAGCTTAPSSSYVPKGENISDPIGVITNRLTTAGIAFTQQDGMAQVPIIFKPADAQIIKKAATIVIDKDTTKISLLVFDYTGHPGSFTLSDTLGSLGDSAHKQKPEIESGFLMLDSQLEASALYLYQGNYADMKVVQDLLEAKLQIK